MKPMSLWNLLPLERVELPDFPFAQQTDRQGRRQIQGWLETNEVVARASRHIREDEFL